MRKPTHSFRGAALGVVAAAVGVVAGTGPAQAHAPSAQAQAQTQTQTRAEARAVVPQRTPAHLVPRELPPHPSSDWYASDVTKGLPETPPFCVEKTFPSAGATHRTFWTEYDTGATQIVVRTGTVEAARKLAAAAEKKIRNCAADWEARFPEGTASWRDYGALTAEDGAHVYGVHTSYPDSEPGIHLFGVGRDGRTVTVVTWGEMGDYDLAPLADFKRTATTAVVKLYHP
ncbi:hypothetical protein [Streptomyces rapamycinicus]|uniref:PknH-like extracellular domain-containing protein n=2 Tax=Streptomyces rapamycinicus TaxID=1226757 RepID=A0A0A0NHQ5_STRRN|nr:hypothetical protein [Streptomyces rapamycinicus]AGP53895.1 hypothetical protein M271_11480 [Streptomyces rapamycinicus NRRL 5491]MBB4781384.1 hypothetical protein [Streptomyces rapamycinicus]RLV73971.1 hypothetical protein D3C57_132135 [Streptomyces rapamycinicus NRRL 5491]UTO62006.1 hypothetical protein LJB45_06515 [Streptomyces rapamycinicus]UTP29958.1 hypothetical protein LIV37_11630 [Streptomyces rapamycinicus NRRL 5491]